jgi:hypothetical protein
MLEILSYSIFTSEKIEGLGHPRFSMISLQDLLDLRILLYDPSVKREREYTSE